MLTIYPERIRWQGHKRWISTYWKIAGEIDSEKDIETLTGILKAGLKQGKEYVGVVEVGSENKKAQKESSEV